MTACQVCGSRKAGKDGLCWKHNPKDRRYRHGHGSPIIVTEPRTVKEKVANKAMEILTQE